MIELQNIDVIFNRGTNIENHVLKDINLTISNGEFVSIIGGNGAGKSTLMNLLSGSISPINGNILIDGRNITNLPENTRSKIVSRVFQDPTIGTFADLTIEENMALAFKRGVSRGLSVSLNENNRNKFKKILANIGIGIENRLEDNVSLLSGGQRQALSLIMASLLKSKVLLLDEHTAALDPKIAKQIMKLTKQMIDQGGLTALMVTHSLSHALEYGNRTIIMHHGQIAEDIVGENRSRLSPNDLIKYFDL